MNQTSRAMHAKPFADLDEILQDQILAAYGGFNHVSISSQDEIAVRPITLPASRLKALNSRLMLFYTSIARTASDVAGSYVAAALHKEPCMRRIADMVTDAIELLNGSGDLTDFGRLLHEAWRLKN